MARPRDAVIAIRMPFSLLERVKSVAQDLGVRPSQGARMLLGAALGDDASQIAVREAAAIIEPARRRMLQELASEMGPVLENARARFVDDVEGAEVTRRQGGALESEESFR